MDAGAKFDVATLTPSGPVGAQHLQEKTSPKGVVLTLTFM